jgi:aminoglycoside N3'-acetyltransferase
VALRTCTVSFTDSSGVRQSVEAIAQGTEIEVQVRDSDTCHRLTVQQIRRWCDGVADSRDETLKKRRLKQLLA